VWGDYLKDGKRRGNLGQPIPRKGNDFFARKEKRKKEVTVLISKQNQKQNGKGVKLAALKTERGGTEGGSLSSRG